MFCVFSRVLGDSYPQAIQVPAASLAVGVTSVESYYFPFVWWFTEKRKNGFLISAISR